MPSIVNWQFSIKAFSGLRKWLQQAAVCWRGKVIARKMGEEVNEDNYLRRCERCTLVVNSSQWALLCYRLENCRLWLYSVWRSEFDIKYKLSVSEKNHVAMLHFTKISQKGESRTISKCQIMRRFVRKSRTNSFVLLHWQRMVLLCRFSRTRFWGESSQLS